MCYFYTWAKESKTLQGKLTKKKLENSEDIKNYYWEDDFIKDLSNENCSKKS